MPQEYQQLHYNLGHKITAIVATGNGLAYTTGRLSYTFGLQVQPAFECTCHKGLHHTDRYLLHSAKMCLCTTSSSKWSRTVLLSCSDRGATFDPGLLSV